MVFQLDEPSRPGDVWTQPLDGGAPVRVTGHDIPYPPAKLEKHHLPDLDRILDAVDRVLDKPNSMTGVQL